MKRSNKRMSRNRPFVRRGPRTVQRYNNTSVNIQRIIEVPNGSSGKVFQVADLLKDYFADPKNIRIDRYIVKVNLIDSTQTFTTFQILSVLDDENNPPTVMTNARPVNINGTICHVTKPSQRRFYTVSTNELTELVVHFTAPRATTVFVDITTFFKVERDLLDSVPTVAAEETFTAKVREDFEHLTTMSTSSAKPAPKRLSKK